MAVIGNLLSHMLEGKSGNCFLSSIEEQIYLSMHKDYQFLHHKIERAKGLIVWAMVALIVVNKPVWCEVLEQKKENKIYQNVRSKWVF